jgi:hypothetical protein
MYSNNTHHTIRPSGEINYENVVEDRLFEIINEAKRKKQQELQEKYANDKFTHNVMNNGIYRYADCEIEDVEGVFEDLLFFLLVFL